MNILFVRNYPTVDGVFTLLLRLSKQFKLDGHTPYYIDFGNKTDFDHEISETFILLSIVDINAQKNLPHIDILFPFADGELLYWCINYLKNGLFRNAKMVFGVYHPRAYFASSYIGSTPDTRLHKLIFHKMPANNILFMNEIVKREHENYFNTRFENSPIIPLPVTLSNKIRDLTQINRKKIVSIGRLEYSKRYIIPMIDVIKELHKKGHDFEFYIYGHGQLNQIVENYIAEKKVGHLVFLMWKLNHEDIYNVMKDAFLFVGMGTSIIEVSSIGVPSLQAIDSEKRPVTYGFFSNLSGFSIGEIKLDLPLVQMRTSIIELFAKNQFEYEKICKAHIERANTFNIDEVVKDYYNFILNALPNFNLSISKYKLFLYKIIRQIYKIKLITPEQYKSK